MPPDLSLLDGAPPILEAGEGALAAPSGRIKILFLAATPEDTPPLDLVKEIRAITEQLQKADHGARFEVIQVWGATVDELQEKLQDHRPQIVHFSGHGQRLGAGGTAPASTRDLPPARKAPVSSGLVVADESGQRVAIAPRPLAQLFGILRAKGMGVRCVVLNACYSEPHAAALCEHVDVVVGMSGTVADASAIAFAGAFYQALGFGQSLQAAFELGKNQVDLRGLRDTDVPKLRVAKSTDADHVLLLGEAARRPLPPSRAAGTPARLRHLECDRSDAWNTLHSAVRSAGAHVLFLCGKPGSGHRHFAERIEKLAAAELAQKEVGVTVVPLPGSILRITKPDAALAFVDALDVDKDHVVDKMRAILAQRSLILVYPMVRGARDAAWVARHFDQAWPQLLPALGKGRRSLVAVQPICWPQTFWDWIPWFSGHRRAHRWLRPLLLQKDVEGARILANDLQIWQAPLGRIRKGHIDAILTEAYADDPDARRSALEQTAELEEKSPEEIFDWLEDELR